MNNQKQKQGTGKGVRTDEEIKTVLIIEDSPTQARRLDLILQHNNLEILLANSGEEGLRLAHTHLPAAIILDIKLPDIDGLEVCKRLKEDESTATIPIILMTQFKDRETVIHGFQSGAIEFIPKGGFSDMVLVETLRQTGVIKD